MSVFSIDYIYGCINDLLPEGEKCKSVSVYPLPYKGFKELFVECESGKRFRALCDDKVCVSEFNEFVLGPAQGVPANAK